MSEVRQRVIVTGGAAGIGRGVAVAFADRGASVLVADVNEEAAEETLRRIESAGGCGRFVKTDVGRLEQIKEMVEAAVDGLGGVDVLVNNAGIAHGPRAERHFFYTDSEMWQTLMQVNLTSVYWCSRLVARRMVEQGGGGSIVNMSTVGARRAHRQRVAYDAAKGAIEAATRAMALDLAPWGIRVNAVAPGPIVVESRTAVGGETDPRQLIPLGRLGTPQDVAAAVVFLSQPEAEFITGQVLTVDGGMSIQLRPPAFDVPVDLSPDEIPPLKALLDEETVD